jgi:DNA-binding NarL/FixJ family response regulator
MTMRVLLVDDQTLIRAALRALVQAIPGVQVVAEAADGREALQLAEQHEPDVVLMDIAMAGMNGLEATSRLVKARPKTHVVILSAHTSEDYVMQALRAGAGYLPKNAACRARSALRVARETLSEPTRIARRNR